MLIHKDLTSHKYHYTLLIVVEALLLSIFIGSKDQMVQLLSAFSVGVFYTIWGFLSHAGEIRTLRLMLEYVSVGLLGTLILVLLVKSV